MTQERIAVIGSGPVGGHCNRRINEGMGVREPRSFAPFVADCWSL